MRGDPGASPDGVPGHPKHGGRLSSTTWPASRHGPRVRRYVSSFAALHKALRQPNPLDSASVRFALQRMHRRRGRRQAQVQGLTWPLRNRLLEAAGDRLIDVRDRALLAVGYDTLLRRAELVSLEVTDLLEDIDGTATLLVRSGKTDPDGRGAMLYLARDTVQMVKAWVRFRSGVGIGATVPLGAQGRYGGREARRQPGATHLQANGPSGGTYRRHRGHARRSQHARRGGEDMIACGIELPAILQSGRWKSARMVQRYGERLLARRSGAAQLAERQRR